MGIRRFRLLAVLTLATLVPSLAMARGYGRRGGTIITPFGPMKMNSPEYRMSGGNPFVYQQLMEQKRLLLQQQVLLKQQQRYMQQRQREARGKKTKGDLQPVAPVSNVTSLSSGKRKKKKPVAPIKSASASSTNAEAKP